jgi:hypothetical protein
MAGDFLNARLGDDALRNSILTVVVVASTWAAAHFLLSGQSLRTDLATAEASG